MDLLNLEKNKVSTDPRDYNTWLIGEPKIGKTTFFKDLYGDRALFIATEKRYGALEGYVQYVSDWVQFLNVLGQLKKKGVRERFDVVIIDTVDNLVSYCKNYVAKNKYQEDELGENGNNFGKDYNTAYNTFENTMKKFESLGYGYNFISHSAEKTTTKHISALSKEDKELLHGKYQRSKDQEDSVDFKQVVPAVKPKFASILANMVDNQVYCDYNQNNERILYLRGNSVYVGGNTFKNTPDVIKFDADIFVNTIQDALKDYEHTVKHGKAHSDKEAEYDFDDLMEKAKSLVLDFHDEDKMNVVTKITNKVLGKGKMVADLTEDSVQDLALIVNSLESEHAAYFGK